MKSIKLLVAILPIAGFAATTASAAPLPRMQADAPAAQALPVEKVHGWHHYCAWGPARYHRHVPGAGNVACRYRHSYYGTPYVRSWHWGAPRYHWRHRHGHFSHRGHHGRWR